MPSRSTFVKTSVVALLIAVLYRYWLVTPAVKYLSIGKWYLVAMIVAAATGSVLSLWRLRLLAVACASITGLLLGGTWSAWQVPHDVPISMSGAFEAYVALFWRQLLALTVTITVSGFYCARILGTNRLWVQRGRGYNGQSSDRNQ
jgi:hypothetical protein